ncbi:MAG TPA: PQQ-like beta-propeller repeat protein [Petrotogaceae bacterium]|nr:PQQ-like beta-propeller repeat protein [Petrotogaceae bacterium]HNY37117.1 PQQ-like beta-propeller repeat protein [Petrotogaceae bacterium]HOG33478.1 PQQ-like beta-propeller repeat protein [Petrotogaceae bacterium]HPO28285.1 PQQ-like beta-propeller repeat protein [Petrotogaceae bacterium]HQP57506.1 PQQ-like beta-propeller repeat protein [Petrotogaceae bacterium]
MKKLLILCTVCMFFLLTSCISIFEEPALELYWHLYFPGKEYKSPDQGTYFTYDETTGYLYVRFSGERVGCFDLAKKKTVWIRYINSRGLTLINLDIELYKNMVYVIRDDVRKKDKKDPVCAICALDKLTGETVWEYAVTDEKFKSGITVHNGFIYIPDYDKRDGKKGMLVKLDAQTGKVVWINKNVQPVGVTKSLIDEKYSLVYVGTFGNDHIGVAPKVYALDIESGETVWERNILWEEPVIVDIVTVPAVYGDSVYVGTWHGEFVRLRRTDGRVVWSAEYPERGFGFGARIWVYKNTLISSFVDGGVVCIDPSDGKILWHTKNPEPTIEDCYMKGNRVYIHGATNSFKCFSADTGKEIWTYTYSNFNGTEYGRMGGAPFKAGKYFITGDVGGNLMIYIEKK